MKKLTISAVAALSMFVASGCDGGGATWGPVTSSYKGQVRVEGRGRFFNEGYRTATNSIQYRDPMQNDGNNVYVRTTIRWWKRNYVGDLGWVAGGSKPKSTKEIKESRLTDAKVSWDLDGDASRVRANPQVCAQMGWPVPDSCTSGGVPTFDY